MPGYGSSSRLYERADSHLGMTPAAYRSGAGVADPVFHRPTRQSARAGRDTDVESARSVWRLERRPCSSVA